MTALHLGSSQEIMSLLSKASATTTDKIPASEWSMGYWRA